MIDRLRLLLRRPLSDRERRRLFALAAGVIVAAAGLLALTDRPRSQHRGSATTETMAPTFRSPEAVAPSASDAVTLRAPSEEGRPRKDLEGAAADVEAAKHAARRFLDGYLPYSYGRRSARSILAVTASLRRRLAAQRPRVNARDRHRRPRLVLVQSNGVGPVRAELVALVRDGSLRYTVPLELARHRSGWAVTAVGS